MRSSIRKSFLVLLLLMPALAGKAALAASEKTDLVVVSDSGRHHFGVELARTPDQQATGLMYRDHLAADAGMLFVYSQPRRVSMWMKNTLIPLDMLFIAPDGRIESIVKRAVPRSLATISSRGKVRAVLELNGGTVDRLEIQPGDRVVHPIFENSREGPQ